MYEVTKEEFFKSFQYLRCTTGCPTSSHKVWEVRTWINGSYVLRARSVECDDGVERFYVMQLKGL